MKSETGYELTMATCLVVSTAERLFLRRRLPRRMTSLHRFGNLLSSGGAHPAFRAGFTSWRRRWTWYGNTAGSTFSQLGKFRVDS